MFLFFKRINLQLTLAFCLKYFRMIVDGFYPLETTQTVKLLFSFLLFFCIDQFGNLNLLSFRILINWFKAKKNFTAVFFLSHFSSLKF